MRQAGRVPANRRVEVNRQIYPAMSGFVIEARTAMTLPKHLSVQEITELGDLTYANVLSGLLTPLEAVCDFGRGVLEIAPALRAQATLPMTCPDPTEDT
jgi:hypothetical protein